MDLIFLEGYREWEMVFHTLLMFAMLSFLYLGNDVYVCTAYGGTAVIFTQISIFQTTPVQWLVDHLPSWASDGLIVHMQNCTGR